MEQIFTVIEFPFALIWTLGEFLFGEAGGFIVYALLIGLVLFVTGKGHKNSGHDDYRDEINGDST